ncbi:MAG: hypothetical protein WCG86_09220, partial [Actinomycetota bacterium]
MKPVGVVISEVPEGCDQSTIERMIGTGMESVGPGRALAVTYYLPDEWSRSTPVESIVVRTVLGNPSHRIEQPEWEFFGNLGIRLCLGTGAARQVRREMGVVILRRVGPKPYQRRHQVDQSTIDASTLPALHPVFTRDVANNVW